MRKVTMRTKNEVTLQEAIDYFIRKGTVKNLAPKTLETYTKRLRVFQCFLDNESFTVKDVTKNIIDDFTIYLKEEGQRGDITVTSHNELIDAIEYGNLMDFEEYLERETAENGGNDYD